MLGLDKTLERIMESVREMTVDITEMNSKAIIEGFERGAKIIADKLEKIHKDLH